MTDMNGTENSFASQRYLLQFTAYYVLCIVAVVAITSLLKFDVPSSMGIITLIAATAPVIQGFVKRENRVPSKSERMKFATLATVITLILTALFIALWLAIYKANPFDLMQAMAIPAWVILAGALFAAVLSWVVVYFFTGFMSRQAMKQIEKAKSK